MNESTEGMLVASHCMLLSLLKMLAAEGALPPKKMAALMGDAEEILATLTPDLMSASARERAKQILQAVGKIS